MTLLTALALLPVAGIANVAIVVALANHFGGDRSAAGFSGPVPTLA